MEKIKAEIVPATAEHVTVIAARIRDEDREEVWATSMSSPERCLSRGLEYSDNPMVLVLDGFPVCMWGSVSDCLLSRSGIPWMLGTVDLENPRMAYAFLRQCRAPLREMMDRYDSLKNYVDARNTRSIRWLRFMGFTVEKEAEPYGILQMPFHKFWMKKEA